MLRDRHKVERKGGHSWDMKDTEDGSRHKGQVLGGATLRKEGGRQARGGGGSRRVPGTHQEEALTSVW